MLMEPMLEKLNAMKLFGMAKYLRQWMEAPPKEKAMAPLDLAGLLADAEWVYRDNRRLELRLQNAKFKQQACIEDIDYAHPRGLSKAVMLDLASSRWVQSHQNIILVGATGLGKSWLACALGQKACRDGFTVVYRRVPRLFDELAQARADGTHPHLLRRLAKAQVLVLDDFGLEPLTPAQRRDLLEVVEDRYKLGSTIITSQLDTGDWHGAIGDATVADSICDRLVHNAHKVKLSGESIRKLQGLKSPAEKSKKEASK
jgi:DNA replication protein DnaC